MIFHFFLPLFLTGVCLVPEKTDERKGKEREVIYFSLIFLRPSPTHNTKMV